jgi:hypothetical protein
MTRAQWLAAYTARLCERGFPPNAAQDLADTVEFDGPLALSLSDDPCEAADDELDLINSDG